MGAWQLTKQTNALGLDVEGHIVLSDLGQVGQDFICRDIVMLPGDDALSSLVECKRIVRERGWQGRPVAISIPSEHVILRRMTLPAMPTSALRSAIQSAIENRLQLSVSDPVFDFHIMSPQGGSARPDSVGEHTSLFARWFGRKRGSRASSGESEVLVAISPRSEVMRWSQFAEQVGLRPVAAEPSLVSVTRALSLESDSDWLIEDASEAQSSNRAINVIVVLGPFGLQFGLVEDEVITFIRHIELTSPRADAAVSSDSMYEGAATEETHTQAYVMEATYELERSLSFVQYNVLPSGQKIHSVWIVDKLQLGQELAAALEVRVDVPVRMARFRFQIDSQLDLTLADKAVMRHLTAVANGLVMGVIA